MKPSHILWLLALAAVASGCSGVAPPNTLTVFNRTPDKVTLELVPVGMSDPTVSPLYNKVELKARSHREIQVPSAYYSIRAVQDDWEGELRRRLDRKIAEDAILTIEPGCQLTFVLEPDPLLEGSID